MRRFAGILQWGDQCGGLACQRVARDAEGILFTLAVAGDICGDGWLEVGLRPPHSRVSVSPGAFAVFRDRQGISMTLTDATYGLYSTESRFRP